MGTEEADARELVVERLSSADVRVSEAQLSQLSAYWLLLRRWNARINLTALDDAAEAIDRLVAEPVLASRVLDTRAATLIDVGSGGGSPAIPLKIMRPDLALTMIEIRSKKAVFLREAARHLALERVTVASEPFERVLTGPTVIGTVDSLSVRAVRVDADRLAVFAAALRPGGQFLWFVSSTQERPPLPHGLHLETRFPLLGSPSSLCLMHRKS